MDLHHQAEVKKLAEELGQDSLVVILGSPDPDSAKLYGETLVSGDPTFAGPLAEVQLGLDVYHVLEDEFRSSIPESVYDEQVGIMADVLDADAIASTMKEIRGSVSR